VREQRERSRGGKTSAHLKIFVSNAGDGQRWGERDRGWRGRERERIEKDEEEEEEEEEEGARGDSLALLEAGRCDHELDLIARHQDHL